MTWPHLLRTAVIAILGTIALALASHARAEGGEAPSLMSPDEALRTAFADPAGQEEPAPDSEEAMEAAVDPAAADGEQAAAPAKRQADAAKAAALQPLIARHASDNGLPYELADAVVRLESRYNAGARNGPNMGLTQINVRTAQSLGYRGEASGLLDAETNLRYGLRYLARAYRLAGQDTCGAILRYQFGLRAQAMTGASRTYCAKVKVITAAAR